ncbi:MAG: hypothetical protein A4E60_03326 [Syntrophorhabdus sp. PtaB.Bin047]|nr:MAG: hypothetical protein A4E60_03326 [Syntrophorhabdus sp. PtaB.Bin047]
MKRRDPQELLRTIRRLCPPGEGTGAPMTIISRDDTGFVGRMKVTPEAGLRMEGTLRDLRGK